MSTRKGLEIRKDFFSALELTRARKLRFLKEYFSTGRPFVLRNHVPEEELKLFSKEKVLVLISFVTTAHFNLIITREMSRNISI